MELSNLRKHHEKHNSKTSPELVSYREPNYQGGRRCCRRPQNGQNCLPQKADFYKIVPKAADLIFAGAVDL